jgi:hypothetical protein
VAWLGMGSGEAGIWVQLVLQLEVGVVSSGSSPRAGSQAKVKEAGLE